MRLLPTIIVLVLISFCAASLEAGTSEDVDRAIGRMQRYLLGRQHPTQGSWEARFANAQNAGGETALVTLALLKSGVPAQDPYLAKAIEYLARTPMIGGFAVSARAQVWAALPDEHRPKLQADTQWLMESVDREKAFTFALSPGAPGNIGESSALINAQYGILGLWEAAERSVDVPASVWQDRMNLLLRAQNADGGWGYLAKDNASYGSMTAAGLASLLIARRQILSRQNLAQPEVALAIDRAWGWLDSRFSGGREPGNADGWHYYYLYAIERAGQAGGVRTLNGEDWWESGLTHILANQAADGGVNGNNVDTAFTLLFLSRGKVPVNVVKLTLQPGERHDVNPLDIDRFTRFLSDLREGELNWLRVDVSEPGDTWLISPLAILPCDAPSRLTDRQRSSLKRYLDLGGTVVIHPVKQTEGFDKAVRTLAAQLYPELKPRSLPENHQAYHLLTEVPAAGRRGVWGISNQTREMMIWTDRELGVSLQSKVPSLANADWCLMTNLWALTSGRGTWPDRLRPVFEPRAKTEAVGTVTVARITLGQNASAGAAVPAEPGAWDAFAAWLFNRTRLELVPSNVELDRLTSTTTVAHLAGTDPVDLSEAELQAIERYVASGGTLLVESVGGRGSFAVHVERSLVSRFAGYSSPLSTTHPIVCGQGLRGGYDLRRAGITPSARLDLLLTPTVQLRAIEVNGRAAIIFSDLDLSLGMMGVRHWGVRGYATETARRLVTNILLAANPRLSPAAPQVALLAPPTRTAETNALQAASVQPGENAAPATQPKAVNPAELASLLAQAKAAQKQDQWDQSLRFLERAAALKPSDELSGQIATVRSRIALEQGKRRLAVKDWEGAQKAFTQSIELQDNPEARIGLAKIEADRPKDPDVIRGFAALKAGDYETAASALQTAVDAGADTEVQSKLRAARLRLIVRAAKAQLAKGEFEVARNMFAKAQEMDPLDAEAVAGASEAKRGLDYRQALRNGDELMTRQQYGPAKDEFRRARRFLDNPEVRPRIEEADYQMSLAEVRQLAAAQEWKQVRLLLPNLIKLRPTDEVRQIQAQLAEHDAKQVTTSTPADKGVR